MHPAGGVSSKELNDHSQRVLRTADKISLLESFPLKTNITPQHQHAADAAGRSTASAQTPRLPRLPIALESTHQAAQPHTARALSSTSNSGLKDHFPQNGTTTASRAAIRAFSRGGDRNEAVLSRARSRGGPDNNITVGQQSTSPTSSFYNQTLPTAKKKKDRYSRPSFSRGGGGGGSGGPTPLPPNPPRKNQILSAVALRYSDRAEMDHIHWKNSSERISAEEHKNALLEVTSTLMNLFQYKLLSPSQLKEVLKRQKLQQEAHDRALEILARQELTLDDIDPAVLAINGQLGDLPSFVPIGGDGGKEGDIQLQLPPEGEGTLSALDGEGEADVPIKRGAALGQKLPTPHGEEAPLHGHEGGVFSGALPSKIRKAGKAFAVPRKIRQLQEERLRAEAALAAAGGMSPSGGEANSALLSRMAEHRKSSVLRMNQSLNKKRNDSLMQDVGSFVDAPSPPQAVSQTNTAIQPSAVEEDSTIPPSDQKENIKKNREEELKLKVSTEEEEVVMLDASNLPPVDNDLNDSDAEPAELLGTLSEDPKIRELQLQRFKLQNQYDELRSQMQQKVRMVDKETSVIKEKDSMEDYKSLVLDKQTHKDSQKHLKKLLHEALKNYSEKLDLLDAKAAKRKAEHGGYGEAVPPMPTLEEEIEQEESGSGGVSFRSRTDSDASGGGVGLQVLSVGVDPGAKGASAEGQKTSEEDDDRESSNLSRTGGGGGGDPMELSKTASRIDSMANLSRTASGAGGENADDDEEEDSLSSTLVLHKRKMKELADKLAATSRSSSAILYGEELEATNRTAQPAENSEDRAPSSPFPVSGLRVLSDPSIAANEGDGSTPQDSQDGSPESSILRPLALKPSRHGSLPFIGSTPATGSQTKSSMEGSINSNTIKLPPRKKTLSDGRNSGVGLLSQSISNNRGENPSSGMDSQRPKPAAVRESPVSSEQRKFPSVGRHQDQKRDSSTPTASLSRRKSPRASTVSSASSGAPGSRKQSQSVAGTAATKKRTLSSEKPIVELLSAPFELPGSGGSSGAGAGIAFSPSADFSKMFKIKEFGKSTAQSANKSGLRSGGGMLGTSSFGKSTSQNNKSASGQQHYDEPSDSDSESEDGTKTVDHRWKILSEERPVISLLNVAEKRLEAVREKNQKADQQLVTQGKKIVGPRESHKITDKQAIDIAMEAEVNEELKEEMAQQEQIGVLLKEQQTKVAEAKDQIKLLVLGSEEEKFATASDLVHIVSGPEDKNGSQPKEGGADLANQESSMKSQTTFFMPDPTEEFWSADFSENKSTGTQTQPMRDTSTTHGGPHDGDAANQDGVPQVEDAYQHEELLYSGFKNLMTSVASVAKFHEDLEVDISCKSCLMIPRRPRLLWPCGHTFCEDCLLEMFEDPETIVCAECGRQTEQGYSTNYALENISIQADPSVANSYATASGAGLPNRRDNLIAASKGGLLSTPPSSGIDPTTGLPIERPPSILETLKSLMKDIQAVKEQVTLSYYDTENAMVGSVEEIIVLAERLLNDDEYDSDNPTNGSNNHQEASSVLVDGPDVIIGGGEREEYERTGAVGATASSSLARDNSEYFLQ